MCIFRAEQPSFNDDKDSVNSDKLSNWIQVSASKQSQFFIISSCKNVVWVFTAEERGIAAAKEQS